jgi:hypothetical protein
MPRRSHTTYGCTKWGRPPLETRYARDEAEVVQVLVLERQRVRKRREQTEEQQDAARRKAVTLPKLKFMERKP